MYYALTNAYGTETSTGFASAWSVRAFKMRATRDQFVAESTTLDVRAATRRELRRLGMKSATVYERAGSGARNWTETDEMVML